MSDHSKYTQSLDHIEQAKESPTILVEESLVLLRALYKSLIDCLGLPTESMLTPHAGSMFIQTFSHHLRQLQIVIKKSKKEPFHFNRISSLFKSPPEDLSTIFSHLDKTIIELHINKLTPNMEKLKDILKKVSFKQNMLKTLGANLKQQLEKLHYLEQRKEPFYIKNISSEELKTLVGLSSKSAKSASIFSLSASIFSLS